jgi:hypothetical protein
MNLKNYTSAIPAKITIANIESYLAECGITGIAKKYKEGRCTALVFEAPDTGGNRTIQLPSDVEAVQDYLWSEYHGRIRNRTGKTRDDFGEQAERTAWKLMDDWVRVQMTLIAVQKKTITEVFLAYVMVSRDQTFFQQLKGNQFKALPEPHNENQFKALPEPQ